jgi:hypothetical protein
MSGKTFEELRTELIERLENNNIALVMDMEGLAAWIRTRKNYPEVIEAAREYIRSKKLCLSCSKYMPPVGASRENGAGHDDWKDRAFHKQCYRQLCKDFETSS